MPKTISPQVFQAILGAISRFPAGAGIEQIESGLAVRPNRRTLQRQIAVLLAQQQVRSEGRGRATRYHLAPVSPAAGHMLAEPSGVLPPRGLLPLSPEAQAVAALVEQPLLLRHPVGYNRAFLDAYRPNETFYLPAGMRETMQAQGQLGEQANEPAGTYTRQLANRLLIDLSWNSSRLEGNTYSLLETERLLSAGEAAAGRAALEAQMILNHKAAIEFLLDAAGEIGFNRYTVLNLHALLAENLLDDLTAPGRLRTSPVGIGQAVFLPLEGPQRIAECFDQVLDTVEAIRDPFEQAFFAMVHLPYLQPFDDVNKRVSRLAANIPLIRHRLCPLSFVDVPRPVYISAVLGVYELNRVELLRDVFAWAYRRSCGRYSALRQSLGEPDPFRLRYRQQVFQAVAEAVRGRMHQSQAARHVRQYAEAHLPEAHRQRFIEVAETELLSLHEGSMARYRIRPAEFQAWRAVWG